MASQYSYSEAYNSPENEYYSEQLEKRLRYSMANFALIKFKRYMQHRMSMLEENK